RYREALNDYDAAIENDPNFAPAFQNRGWLRATCPEASYRDGSKAVESATRAGELIGWRAAAYLDVLAPAQAEAGNFAEAVKWENEALSNLPEGPSKARTRYEAHLKLYQDKKPLREELPR